MLKQVKFSSLGRFPLLPFSDKPFTNATGVELAGTTEEARKFTLNLLEDGHKKYDVFFNQKGFHDHSLHHLLAAYSCGASTEVLNGIAKNSPHRQSFPSKVLITENNWLEHLGDSEAYTDFLTFFEEAVEQEGAQVIFEKYAFHQELLPRLFDGAFHPIIQLGYGVEFQLPFVIAEGLAQAAVHKNRVKEILTNDYFSHKGTEKRKIMDIIEGTQRDPLFEGVIRFENKGKILMAAEKLAEPIKETAKSWVIDETEEGTMEATKELFEAVALLFGATAIRPDKSVLAIDFFLMHALTSALMVYAILPYVNIEKRVKLLKAHFAVTLLVYVAAGRPHLHVDELKRYTPKILSNEPNPWHDVVKYSLLEEKQSHIIKTIRSLLKAEHEWGAGEDNLYVKIGQLTYEAYKTYGFNDDIGFDESWDEKHRL